MQYPDDETEFGRCWSSTAGELSAVKSAIVEVEKRAGEAFIRKRDEVANALRDLASELGRRRDELSKKVDEYIAEDKKRTYERTKPFRH